MPRKKAKEINLEALEEAFKMLEEVKNDFLTPKNVKSKIDQVETILKENDNEIQIRINKALHELEEIADDINLQPFTRTQLWNIVSILEKIIA
ncbi:hypothetical protein DRZ77_03030 [Candidatus Woesearchaeota archaeon]|nr:UPF0147 family protein [Candidatus Woesearchaeota archaeon]RLE40087.1 MAG: hypothetical protein DRZ77_03030 [Candidatus Woesearchaeota archaeon]